MKNRNGFGKFEVLTIIVIIMIIFCVVGYYFLGGVSDRKIDTMKKSAISFSNTVGTNIATFHNSGMVYLQEAIDESLIGQIKSPVGMGNCSTSESYVEFIDSVPYVTLKCNDILMEKGKFIGDDKQDIYRVSDWSLKKKSDNDEEKVLYNCVDNNKEVFDKYYEELYFVYEINKKFGTYYYFPEEVKGNCEVVKKTFYRTKEKIK